MFSRIRVALGIALLVALVTSIAAFAKGGFSFISITGGNLKDELRVTDPKLTTDFFAFADFSQDKTTAPADPGNGYEINRYYADASGETAFDRLHYYPETSFVYYDGIVNGSSEYDGKWYTAQPDIKTAFESALPGQVKSVEPAAQQPVPAPRQAQSNTPNLQTQTILLIAITTGLAVILLLALLVPPASYSLMEVNMYSRFGISIGLALLLAFVFAFPAFGGGWAVITLDELPTGVSAGEPLTIGFTVLQHGRTPLSGLDPTITANLYKEQEFVVHAEPEGEPGHYTATLTFPKEGNWRWSIQAFTMDQPMPELAVAAPGAVSRPMTESKPADVPWLMIVRGLLFGMALVGMVVTFRRRSRVAAALTGLCLLIGIGTFITGATALEVEAQSKSISQASIESSTSQVDLGRHLFIAKGCITCHYNDKAAKRSEYWTIEMGAPDLTKFTASPEALRLRLKDPSSVKSDTKMPNLNLSEAEIEALITFINSE